MRFNVSTKTNVSALTERQKKFLDYDPWNRPLVNGLQLKLHILIQTLQENTELDFTNG